MKLSKNNIRAILDLLSETDDPTLLDAWENLIGVILIKNPNLFEDYDKISKIRKKWKPTLRNIQSKNNL